MLWYPPVSSLWRLRLGWAALSRSKDAVFGPAEASAWAAFYVAEERSGQSLPLLAYAKMLCDHGCPDVGNPIPNDDESHFLIHPGGFIAGEFDRCLRPAETELDLARGEQSLGRLGLLAHLNCPMLSAKSYWAAEDLSFAMAIACLEGRWDLAGARPSRVVVNALRQGLLEPQAAPGLLVARRMAEALWHRAPWAPPLEQSAPEPEEPTPPAPELDLASWRSKR